MERRRHRRRHRRAYAGRPRRAPEQGQRARQQPWRAEHPDERVDDLRPGKHRRVRVQPSRHRADHHHARRLRVPRRPSHGVRREGPRGRGHRENAARPSRRALHLRRHLPRRQAHRVRKPARDPRHPLRHARAAGLQRSLLRHRPGGVRLRRLFGAGERSGLVHPLVRARQRLQLLHRRSEGAPPAHLGVPALVHRCRQ